MRSLAQEFVEQPPRRMAAIANRLLDALVPDCSHGGGRQFESKEDPNWQNMAEWVSGRKVANSPAPQ
jgi:hypothetical protein